MLQMKEERKREGGKSTDLLVKPEGRKFCSYGMQANASFELH